jgi:hypothetical protein
MKATFHAIPLLAALALSSCGDTGPTSSTDTSTTGTRSIQATPSFASTVQEIFSRKGCTSSSCHGSAQMAGLDLRSGASYASLVGVRATSESIVRVIPGNADGSYLVIKVEGRQSVGARMPQTGSPLDAIDLTNLRNWIDQGAQNN